MKSVITFDRIFALVIKAKRFYYSGKLIKRIQILVWILIK